MFTWCAMSRHLTWRLHPYSTSYPYSFVPPPFFYEKTTTGGRATASPLLSLNIDLLEELHKLVTDAVLTVYTHIVLAPSLLSLLLPTRRVTDGSVDVYFRETTLFAFYTLN